MLVLIVEQGYACDILEGIFFIYVIVNENGVLKVCFYITFIN